MRGGAEHVWSSTTTLAMACRAVRAAVFPSPHRRGPRRGVRASAEPAKRHGLGGDFYGSAVGVDLGAYGERACASAMCVATAEPGQHSRGEQQRVEASSTSVHQRTPPQQSSAPPQRHSHLPTRMYHCAVPSLKPLLARSVETLNTQATGRRYDQLRSGNHQHNRGAAADDECDQWCAHHALRGPIRYHRGAERGSGGGDGRCGGPAQHVPVRQTIHRAAAA